MQSLQSYKVADNCFISCLYTRCVPFIHYPCLSRHTTAKNHASPAVNSSCQPSPSGFLLLPPPLLHSQSARYVPFVSIPLSLHSSSFHLPHTSVSHFVGLRGFLFVFSNAGSRLYSLRFRT